MKLNQNTIQKEFRILFYNYYPQLVAFASRFVDTDTAEDIVQDVFVSILEKNILIKIKKPKTYLFNCVKNSCLNHIKHNHVVDNYKARLAIAEKKAAYYTIDKESDITNSDELVKIIKDAIKTLPEKNRRAFELSFIENKSHKEIAEIMNITTKTVDNHIYNAIKKIRNKVPYFFILFFL